MGNELTAGALVEVRSQAEILGTLDTNGCLDGLPFMPEMLQFCGRRFRVNKRAHKTCDFVTNTGSRRLGNAVFLEDLRCTGASHGGCEARCTIFWKEAWVRPVSDVEGNSAACENLPASQSATGTCTLDRLAEACTSAQTGESVPTYRCQATLLPEFTTPLSAWDIRQYVEDFRSGNVTSLWTALPRFIYRGYDNLINLGVGWGAILRWLYDRFQKVRGGQPYPARSGSIPVGAPTPTREIGIKPGELVRVRSYEEILRTLDTAAKNRGMAFSAEMVPYCGKTMRVLARVTRLIDEKTGKMLQLKNPCIILEGGTCRALYNKKMIFCPRATYAYWREIWVERVPETKSQDAHTPGYASG